MEKELEELKKEIQEIKVRNKRVELDKKWETSYLRKICIAVLTYIVVICYTVLTSKISNVFLSSLVPVSIRKCNCRNSRKEI